MSLVSRCLTACKQLLKTASSHNVVPVRNREFYRIEPKKRYKPWLIKSHRVVHDDFMTNENRRFVQEMVDEQVASCAEANSKVTYEEGPLKDSIVNYGVWRPGVKRTGVIAKKIGDYPMWSKEGKKINSTLLEILENTVVKYTPPEEYQPTAPKIIPVKNKLGCMLIGAETVDPLNITKDYYGIFKQAGVVPKKYLSRFYVSPEAALPAGTPLTVSHFQVGDVIDIRGMTKYQGFQGVMKRWGFKGMPATHGVTKTHRRPGNIGGGGEKGRVWPGKKLPGHMGNKWIVGRGFHILRIEPEHNVLWVEGVAVPGLVGSLLYLYDTVLPLRRRTEQPHFPTHINAGELPEPTYADCVHRFSSPTITYPE